MIIIDQWIQLTVIYSHALLVALTSECCVKKVIAGLGGSVPCLSDWWSGSCWFNPRRVGNILSWRLIMKYFLRSFSPFCWFSFNMTPLGWLGCKTSIQTNKRGLSVKRGLGLVLGHLQTVQTQTRHHRMLHLSRDCTVCLNYRKLRVKRKRS